MGNVSGRREENSEEREEYMEYAHGAAHVSYPAPPDSMVHTPRVYSHTQRPHEMLQIPNDVLLSARDTEQRDGMPSELGIPTMITWCYDGKEVAVQGSWDCWKTREFLQNTGEDFSVLKILPPGVYHYRFIVDGQWLYSPDFPHERDDIGNIFNVLDVKKTVLEDMPEFESPSSPISSYDNSPFTKDDLDEKLPELPPLLQQSLLDQSSSSEDTFEKPLPSVLNHLYIRKKYSSQSLAALSSTHRFRSKFVTVVLYKPTRKLNK